VSKYHIKIINKRAQCFSQIGTKALLVRISKAFSIISCSLLKDVPNERLIIMEYIILSSYENIFSINEVFPAHFIRQEEHLNDFHK
jgi:hypothetical protein